MLLLKLWNEGEVSIPPLRVGLNAYRLECKVTEGVSGQSFDSGHALHAPRIRSVSNSSELW